MGQIFIEPNSRVEVLRTMHDAHRAEINHHREMQFRVFSWTTSLLLAAAASMVAAADVWSAYRPAGVAIITVVVAMMLTTTLMLFRRSAKALESNARMVVKVDLILGLFEANAYAADETVYSSTWLNWGTKRLRASIETWFYLSTTVSLAAIVVLIGWLL